MHFLVLYYFAGSFPFALNNLQVFKANIALLLLLPLFLDITKPLTSFILSLAIARVVLLLTNKGSCFVLLGFIILILVLLTLLSLRALSCSFSLMLLPSLSLKTRA